MFFANVYSLCVCLAYVCASVFINRTFRKSLPPASSASSKRVTAAGGVVRGGGGEEGVRGAVEWFVEEDQKATQTVVIH